MQLTLFVHILAGSLGLIAGYIALYSAKGASLHRKAGTLFVYAMLAVAAGGLALAIGGKVAPAINIPAALLTGYLVLTGQATVRPASAGSRWLDAAGMAMALGVGVTMLALGLHAVAQGGSRSGFAYPAFMFAAVGLLAGAGDIRVLRGGRLQGTARIARHLWRMCFALFIAAMSFFIGQAKVIPEPFRIRPLLALPVLAVLATMFWWMWRVRRKKAVQGLVLAPVVLTVGRRGR